MENKYEKMDNGVIAIYCYGNDICRKVYIDEEDFEKVNSYDISWSIWKNKNGKNKYQVGGCIKDKNGKRTNITMQKAVMQHEGKAVYFVIEENWFDFRKANLILGNVGDLHKGEFRIKREQLKFSYTPVIDDTAYFTQQNPEEKQLQIEDEDYSSCHSNNPNSETTHKMIFSGKNISLHIEGKMHDVTALGITEAAKLYETMISQQFYNKR